MTDPVIRKFAQLISNMAIENVPVAATEQIRWRVLNAFAIMLCADVEQALQAGGSYAASTRNNNGSNVSHAGNRIAIASSGSPGAVNPDENLPKPPVLSALLYGAALDAETPGAGVYRGISTVDAAIIPAAWALVQARQGSGHLFMSALAAGYMATDVLRKLPDPDHSRCWQAAAVNGTVGAAAAAARAGKADPGTVLDALGFATAQTAQLADNAAARAGAYDAADSVERGQPDLPGPGRAAMDGVLSAQMAALGGHCPPTLLDQLQQALSAVDLHHVCSEAWEGVQGYRPCTGDEAILAFRQRVVASISDEEAATIVELVQRLEHTAPGELRRLREARIGGHLNS